MPLRQTDLLPEASDRPGGFNYRRDLISAREEQSLVEAFAPLPFKPFEFQNFLGKREVVSFGWRYDYGQARLLEAAGMPAFLLPLRQAAANFAGARPEAFPQALITRYGPGVAIGWHRDRSVFDQVIGISLLSPAVLRFRRREGAGWRRRSLTLEPRSAYVLAGDARQVWEHSLRPVEALRYSVTFRSLR